MVKGSFTLHRSDALDDKMRIPVIIMFYTAGKCGSDTIHREKCHVNFDEESLLWSKKKLHEQIEYK